MEEDHRSTLCSLQALHQQEILELKNALDSARSVVRYVDKHPIHCVFDMIWVYLFTPCNFSHFLHASI